MNRLLSNRRTFLAAMGSLAITRPAFAAPAIAKAPRPAVAITIDDFGTLDSKIMTAKQRDLSIRTSLDSYKVKAAGFISGKNVDSALGQNLLKTWSDAGHILCNHSYSHSYYGRQDPQKYWEDVMKCEELLKIYPAFRKLFRFPYLAEGTTQQALAEMRRYMAQDGYRNGVVTIDASDWYINRRMTKRQEADPKIDLSQYRQFYLDHIWDRAQYYDKLSHIVFGKSVPHTLLIHHMDVTALFLGDALKMFKERGWDLIDAETAFEAHELQQVYDSIPSGQSILWSAAKAKNIGGPLRYPGENDEYEIPKMDALGL
jgi:peptidoglycan-N-acetylglucosamine deacetylase